MTIDLIHILLLFAAGVLAGLMNSVAGGGSFITFPALLMVGIPPVSANATNTVALWPGSAASVGAYRCELKSQRKHILLLGIVSLAGGWLGAILLLHTRDELFSKLIPYLMLTATLVFAVSPGISRLVRQASGLADNAGVARRATLIMLYLGIAVYGGFFGAGVGILTLAIFSLMGLKSIHEMNALKTFQVMLVNGIAVITFVLAGIIQWPQASAMIIGASIGGYCGAHYHADCLSN